MELELLAVADDRVAGVVAALEADDHVGLLGEQVGDLALALIAPLGADYDHAWHDAGIVTGSASARDRQARLAVAAVVAEERDLVADLVSRETVRGADLLLQLLVRRGWS